mgnify:CR=1 FL=1
MIDVLATSTTVVSDASYAQTRATAPRTWSEEFTRGHGQRQRSCVTDGTVARSQGECTSDEARQRVGTIEVACEASSCERYIWIIAPMHNSTLGIECGFQLVEGGVCVNCSVEPGGKAKRIATWLVSTKRQAVRAYGALLCNRIVSLQHEPTFLALGFSGAICNREISRRSKKHIQGNAYQRRSTSSRRSWCCNGSWIC